MLCHTACHSYFLGLGRTKHFTRQKAWQPRGHQFRGVSCHPTCFEGCRKAAGSQLIGMVDNRQGKRDRTSLSNATAATGSVAAAMAPNSSDWGQVHSYGSTNFTATAVMAVPVITAAPPSSATWAAATIRTRLGRPYAPANRTGGRKSDVSRCGSMSCAHADIACYILSVVFFLLILIQSSWNSCSVYGRKFSVWGPQH